MHSEISHISEYSVRQIYDMIIDVEKYPEFIPGCEKLTVLNKTEANIEAEMTVKLAFMTKRYVSEVRTSYSDTEATVHITSADNFFKHMKGVWSIKYISDSETKVKFVIDFLPRSCIIPGKASYLFESTGAKVAAIFKDRAECLYGKK